MKQKKKNKNRLAILNPRKWIRSIILQYWKLLRNPDKLHRIARGCAFGVAVSFTPFIGFHLILVALFCLLFRGNILAGVIGSLIGNPITFVAIIWPAVFTTGNWILGNLNNGQQNILENLIAAKDIFLEMINDFIMYLKFDYSKLESVFDTVIYPMIIGSIPLFIISFTATYLLTIRLIENYRKKKFENIYKGVKKGTQAVINKTIDIEKKIVNSALNMEKKVVEKAIDFEKKITGKSKDKSKKTKKDSNKKSNKNKDIK